MSLFARFLLGTFLLTALYLTVGFFLNQTSALVVLIVVMGTVIVRNMWYRNKLSQLLLNPYFGNEKSASGVWEEIFHRLSKLVRNWRDEVLRVEIQHNRFIQAMQASPNGVVMLNDDDQIDWCNSIAEQHFGLQAKRDTRQKITHIIRKPAFVQYIMKNDFSEPIRLTDMGDHDQFALQVQIFPYGDNQKLILSQDVSQIEKTDAMRRDFVANVSHELKTPLTVLSGFIETVQEFDLSREDRERYMNLMSLQTVRMQALVEDLLTLAKLEGNPEPPATHAVGISKLLARLKLDAEGLSKGRHKIDVRQLSEHDILGDESELYSAFSNLVSNAIRYTPEHGDVTVEWRDMVDGGVQLSVTDTGHGIEEHHIPRLTERFYRIDRSRSRGTGGTGLGLAIVKHVVSRHQGEMIIQSKLDVGSCFCLQFPASRVQANRTAVVNTGSSLPRE